MFFFLLCFWCGLVLNDLFYAHQRTCLACHQFFLEAAIYGIRMYDDDSDYYLFVVRHSDLGKRKAEKNL